MLRSCADIPYYTNEQFGPFCYELVISPGEWWNKSSLSSQVGSEIGEVILCFTDALSDP